MTVPGPYRVRVEALLAELGIPRELVAGRGLAICNEAHELVVVQTDDDGREHLLIPAAAAAWRRLREAALADEVALSIGSAFRSCDRQAELIRRKLERGLSIEGILTSSAPPGYSEHHTGRAVDVITPGSAPLETEFEETAAFRWLVENAGAFHYEMSFPRDNPHGYVYEPWHWCYREGWGRRDEG
ncbi:MAG TPA: M15 family metallopeptidase [Burkholderiales bacterium]|nr:M15 family metallopeptidase [Burkholderiales bacterium]